MKREADESIARLTYPAFGELPASAENTSKGEQRGLGMAGARLEQKMFGFGQDLCDGGSWLPILEESSVGTFNVWKEHTLAWEGQRVPCNTLHS